MKTLLIQVATELVVEWVRTKKMSGKERTALTALWVALSKLLEVDQTLKNKVEREASKS